MLDRSMTTRFVSEEVAVAAEDPLVAAAFLGEENSQWRAR